MPEKISEHQYHIVPVGTQVVLQREIRSQASLYPMGTVGVISKAPTDTTHTYLVRFPDSAEEALYRKDFTILQHFKAGELSLSGEISFDLEEFLLYKCIVGSKAFGLSVDSSDDDIRGIYLPPAEAHWSLYGVPEQFEDQAKDQCYWELQKFLVLALKANPNILECLFTPLVLKSTELMDELLSMRQIFLSKLIYQTYNGYALSQFKKIEQDFRNHGEVRWEHAMHLIRLLLSGIHTLREGTLVVQMDEYRDWLLSIRHGEIPWAEVNYQRQQLHEEFNQVFLATPLPDRPDYERANLFLLKARRSKVQ